MADNNPFESGEMKGALPSNNDDSLYEDYLVPDPAFQLYGNPAPGVGDEGYGLDADYTFADDTNSSAPSTWGSSGAGSWSQMGSSSSSSMATSIPRQLRGQRLFLDQFAAQPMPSYNNNPRLPCEFDRLADCHMHFAADETSQWIEHVSTHLNFLFPWECVCWFCDDFKFDTSATGGDASHNFHLRMEHIRDHLVNGDYRLHQRRRDYFLLHHLDQNKLISPQVARRELGTSEGPKLPGGGSRKQSSKNNKDESRHKGDAHDQAAEDRRRRKEQKDKGKSKSKKW